MSRTRPVRLVRVALGAVCLVTALAGCVRVPDGGPVVEVQGKVEASPIEGPYSDPRPPQPGAAPQDIVQGFLDAMTATPVQTNAALQFLSRNAQASWNPQKIIVYNNISNPTGSSDVSVRLRRADRIGVRGDWRGALPVADRLMSFPMTLEGDQWRIAKAPNALVVPQLFFERTYQRAQLYFFDPTARVLVPEPTYVPRGGQLVGSLVRGLLRGPKPDLAGVERSFLPPGRALALSVPVTKTGLAEIVLKGAASGALSLHSRQLMLAQLAWTLRQAPSVHTFSLTIEGHPVTDGAGNSVFAVDIGAQYDPRRSFASAPLYALHKGLLVSGPVTGLTPLDGRFGTTAQGIGSFAVSLDGGRVAGTAPGQLLIGRVHGDAPVRRIVGPPGSTFLRPSWDFDRRLWAVEDTADGARVLWVRHVREHPITVPGVTGERVSRFLVSRDGSRLVAVIHGAVADRIVVSRIAYDASGRAVDATRAEGLAWRGGGSQRIKAVGWVSPTSFMVLHLLGQDVSEVRTIAVDGSTSVAGAASSTLPGRLFGLATSPVVTQRSYALSRRALVDLSQGDQSPDVPYRRLHHITYAG